jgi:hypothetical protein
MPRSIGRLSASVLSHHGLSSAVFITNIAESDFRHTQPAIATCLLGVFAGLLLKEPSLQPHQKTLWLPAPR